MINEVVYADKSKIDTKKKTIGITYSKGNRARQNANLLDKLGTNEMDEDNANTIEVPLKGGLISYNITDIKGIDIMHYFKKKWANKQSATMKVKDTDGHSEFYELQMGNNDENDFMKRFVRKVELVVSSWIQKNKRDNIEFSQISILPVKSSSNFNNKFVKEELSKLHINGLSCQIVDPNLITKDFLNAERDEEFINKNKNFYDSEFAVDRPDMGTVNQQVDDIISKNKSLNVIQNSLNEINKLSKILLNFLNNNKKLNSLSNLQIQRLTSYYKRYFDLIKQSYNVKYISPIDNKEHKLHNDYVSSIKYSKGPSIDGRSQLLWNMVKPYLINEKSPVTNELYHQVDLCFWHIKDSEIKKLRNSERLGLKNMFNLNKNLEIQKKEEEINKLKGTILLVFDDNISGGATLSDVCLQCQKLGAENIIPITFGKMHESNTMRGIVLNTPENGYNFSTNNNLSLYSGDKKGKRMYVKKDEKLNKNKELFIRTLGINTDNPVLNILWLDDQREPYDYFTRRRQSKTWDRNYEYYANNIFNQYYPNFIWVKTLDSFKNYILNNKMPDLVSFDYDIRPKNYYGQDYDKGSDAAQWLLNFCKKNNVKLPNTFPHTANKNGLIHLNSILKQNSNIDESNQYFKKRNITLTENEFYNLIKESIKNIIRSL